MIMTGAGCMSLRLLILASPRVTALFSMVTGLVFGLVDLDDAVLFGGELAEADDTSCGESTSGVEAGVWVMWSDWAAVNYSVDAISLE